VFSSSLSGIKFNYNSNPSLEINITYLLNMSIITVKEIQIFGVEEREVNYPYALKITSNTLNAA
jgi:hypothetical protein